MKKVCIFLFILLIFLTGCKGEEISDTSSPTRIVEMMDFYSADPSDDNFKTLFADGFEIDDEYIKNKYDLVRQTKDNKAMISTMGLIRYGNGKSLLVYLYYDWDSDDYYIYDVIEVPDDVADFFERELPNHLTGK